MILEVLELDSWIWFGPIQTNIFSMSLNLVQLFLTQNTQLALPSLVTILYTFLSFKSTFFKTVRLEIHTIHRTNEQQDFRLVTLIAPDKGW